MRTMMVDLQLVLVVLLAVVISLTQGQNSGLCANDISYINRQCAYWAKRGDCSNPTVARECHKACSGCDRGRDCRNDVDTICQSVADEGQCSIGIVREHCSKACSSCGDKRAPSAVKRPHTRRPPTRRPNRRRPVTTTPRPTEYPRVTGSPQEIRLKLQYELGTCFSLFSKPGDYCKKLKALFTCAYSVIYGPQAVQGVTNYMRKEFKNDFKSIFTEFGLDDCGFTFESLKKEFMQSVKEAGKCSERPVDIMYLIDTSSSINSKSAMAYMQALEFAATLLDQFDFQQGNTRVAAIQFANGVFPTHAIDFDKYHTKADIQDAIRKLIYMPGMRGNWMAGSFSHIWKGLDYMREEFLPLTRPKATKVTVVLTDGLSNPGDGKIASSAKKARNAGVKIMAVGIGTAQGKQFQRELEVITGSRSNVYRVNDSSVQARLRHRCREVVCVQRKKTKKTSHRMDLEVLASDVKATIGNGNRQFK